MSLRSTFMNPFKLSYSFFMRIQRNVLHCMGLKKNFMCNTAKLHKKNVAATLPQFSNEFDFVAVLYQHFSCCRRWFLKTAWFSRPLEHFHCNITIFSRLKRSKAPFHHSLRINWWKQTCVLTFKMAEKVNLKLYYEETKTLINVYTKNLVLRNSKDPNYKNKFKRFLIKIKMIWSKSSYFITGILRNCLKKHCTLWELVCWEK